MNKIKLCEKKIEVTRENIILLRKNNKKLKTTKKNEKYLDF